MRAQVYQKLRHRLLVALAHRLPTCKEATQLVSLEMERRLSLRQRVSLKLHLWTCSLCRRYEQQMQFVQHAAQHYDTHAQMPSSTGLSPEARERMKRALNTSS